MQRLKDEQLKLLSRQPQSVDYPHSKNPSFVHLQPPDAFKPHVQTSPEQKQSRQIKKNGETSPKKQKAIEPQAELSSQVSLYGST